MEKSNNLNTVQLVFFSGTGGTKRIALAFEKELKERGIRTIVKNLAASLQEQEDARIRQAEGVLETDSENQLSKTSDLTILIYPVYALDAPRPVYDWIDSMNETDAGGRIVVLSVSGGGEMWPNKGCRNHCCKALEKKGFQVVYDRMLVMPANVLLKYSDDVMMHLIRVIPEKVSAITDDLEAGKNRHTHFRKGPVLNWISKTERENSSKFAQGFTISDDCTGCGWCVRNCPMHNIEISKQSAKPNFSDHCILCTRCIYGCPFHAIKTNVRIIFQSGFNLDDVERRMAGEDLKPVKECCKGWYNKGIRDYLLKLEN